METVAITGTSGFESRDQFHQALADRGLHYSTVTEIPFNIDTSAATDLRYMFFGCAALVTIPEIDTSSVTTMQNMFTSCSSLTSVPDLDTANVTDAEWMFYSCASLTDGSVRLIGKRAAVVTTGMITGSGLTREPFFDAAGNPI